MSKMDNLRAMREARYDKAAAAPSRPAAPNPPRWRPPGSPRRRPRGGGGRERRGACGHRNMSGRTCTREKGHAAKSHRYG